ncbi:hypothetical protein QUV83_07465 [Cellulomonas cellasea]|uniref:hypothetical protein n=1 Tax=Cellulomonas cellasea TaxID=43670 RepID=UPI0025A36C4B|nr:hypothetical protein [Cellulomonas cellasea]MDM8084595.1 hypothetical protein [Cellulomonas cellasea]
MTTTTTPASRRATTARRAGVVTLGLPLALLLASSPATAVRAATDSGDVQVSNTETVQARLDATGKLTAARVYEQLAFTGHGTRTVTNPVSTKGLRNLDGFGGFTVKDGAMQATVTVDGEQRLRTVSDFDGDLPISVDVEYHLDGVKVGPGAVVGKSGELEVRYTVTNLTTRQDEVAYDDGTGKQATTTAETVIPMVGQLTTTLPSTFTAVTSDEANMAGDGRGGTKLSYTMTLFPPIGSPTAEFGYTAQIRDGKIPPASVTALPVSPLKSPSFKGGSASYQGGAESGIALTAGATEIDANLLKLRDGAATLLDGLLQLRDGADQLASGLNDTAAPGASQLATGAKAADTGADALAAGARSADAGAQQVASGAAALGTGLSTAGAKVPELVGGLERIAGGLTTVDDGLARLYGGVDALPKSAEPLKVGVSDLRAGVAGLLAGAKSLSATVSSEGDVLLALGATNPTVTLPATPDATTARVQALGNFVNGVAAKEGDPVTGDPLKKAKLEAIALTYLAAPASSTVNLGPGLTVLGNVLKDGVVPGLVTIQCGLNATATGAACKAASVGLDEGLVGVDGGVDSLVVGVQASVLGAIGTAGQTSADKTLRGGVGSLSTGAAELLAGTKTLVGGLGQLTAGASSLQAGSAQLAGGTRQLATGAGQLSTGTGQLAEGAARLAGGLRTAADGSQTLADGLGTAADGAPAIVDGAEQLSEQGTSVLVETGASTAADYGVKYAVIEAGAARATEESMAYGGPEGAASVTAYSIEIAGADGSGASSVGRGAAAAALFGLGGALAAFARRRFA